MSVSGVALWVWCWQRAAWARPPHHWWSCRTTPATSCTMWCSPRSPFSPCYASCCCPRASARPWPTLWKKERACVALRSSTQEEKEMISHCSVATIRSITRRITRAYSVPPGRCSPRTQCLTGSQSHLSHHCCTLMPFYRVDVMSHHSSVLLHHTSDFYMSFIFNLIFFTYRLSPHPICPVGGAAHGQHQL